MKQDNNIDEETPPRGCTPTAPERPYIVLWREALVRGGHLANLGDRSLCLRVLFVLECHADTRTGQCWPSIETISRQAIGVNSRGESTNNNRIRAALKHLEQVGLIEQVEAGGGRNHSTKRRLACPNPSTETGSVIDPLSSTETGSVIDPLSSTLNGVGERRKQGRSKAQTGSVKGANGVGDRPPNSINSIELIKNSNEGGGNENHQDETKLPGGLNTPHFNEAWKDWLSYRRQRRIPTAEITITRQLAMLSEKGADAACEMIKTSILNGWQGLFDRDKDNKKRESVKSTLAPGQTGKAVYT